MFQSFDTRHSIESILIFNLFSLFQFHFRKILAECQTTEWTDWSVCSASCGQGVRIRTRNYVSVQKSRTAGCSATLIEKNNCDAACVGEVSCATTPWSEWSDCSVMCGKGYRIRTRLFVNREARKVCSQVDLVDTDPCFGVISECAETNLDQIDPKCMVTEWYVLLLLSCCDNLAFHVTHNRPS